MLDLPLEIIYNILEYLDVRDLIVLYYSHPLIKKKIGKYIFSIYFVNHKIKKNTIFKFNLDFFIKHQEKITNIIKYITI